MKLPKYNLSYNTRDLIHSLAKSTCERKHVLKINPNFLKQLYNFPVPIRFDIKSVVGTIDNEAG